VIDPGLYLAFVLATILLMLIPGPNVALIIANSVAYGTRFGLLTVAGTASAMVVQLALTAFGLAAALGTLGAWLEWLRWLGVAYLLVLGVRQWRTPPADLTRVPAQPRSARRIFARGLLVSLTNPKTLFFYGAFFPQFIVAGRAPGPQAALLAGTFLALALLIDGLWAMLAGRARAVLARRR
jgi:homoserine/homoserine lactone efflux protein